MSSIVVWGVFGRLRAFHHPIPPKQSRMGFSVDVFLASPNENQIKS